MAIDFHDGKNRNSYTTREVDRSWTETISALVPFEKIEKAADVGCGGGIYSKALSAMGAPFVMGVDFSETMLDAARENCKSSPSIAFQYGTALRTGLDNTAVDLILERALIHHISDLQACFQEAYRILKSGGYFIIQDRTPDDCLLGGDNHHIRGYFFECFPHLMEKETNRRHTSGRVIETLQAAGFKDIQEIKLWETRKVYDHKEDLLQDLRQRTGRSILHELDEKELEMLVTYIDNAVLSDTPINEKDRWTIWAAVKED